MSVLAAAPFPRPRPRPKTRAGTKDVPPVPMSPLDSTQSVSVPNANLPHTTEPQLPAVTPPPIVNPLYVQYSLSLFIFIRNASSHRNPLFGPALGPSARLQSLLKPAPTKLIASKGMPASTFFFFERL
jgi:hypothetical protein